MTIRSISIFLLVVGVFWGLLVSGFIALLSGFFGNAPPWDPLVIGKLLLWFSWLFAGPLVLIAGTILALLGSHQKAGLILSLVGCFILTVMVGYQSLTALHNAANPLIMKPPYGLYAVTIILTLLADVGALQLYRLIVK